MIEFIFVSFLHSRPDFGLLNPDKVKSAWENSDEHSGEVFKRGAYVGYLKAYLKIIEELPMSSLLAQYTGNTKLINTVKAIFEEDEDNEEKEETDLKMIRFKMLKENLLKFKLKDIDTNINEMMGLYDSDIISESGESSTHSKLLEVLLYNIKNQEDKHWEAGSNYSDFQNDKYDMVETTYEDRVIITEKYKSGGDDKRMRLSNIKTAEVKFQVTIDTGKYFEKLFKEKNIIYTLTSIDKSSLRENMPIRAQKKKPHISLETLGIDWKEFGPSFVKHNKKHNTLILNTKTANPTIGEFDLVTAMKQQNLKLGKVLRRELTPNIFKTITIFLSVVLHPTSNIEENKKLMPLIVEEPTMSPIVRVDRVVIIDDSKVNAAQWAYSGMEPKSGGKIASNLPRGIKVTQDKKGENLHPFGDTKLANILLSMKRKYDRLKVVIK